MSNLSPAAVIYDSGGTEKATSGNPLRVDPTGTTAQPVTDNGSSLTVDGTVTANAGTGTFAVSAASLPLPTGAATSANQTTIGSQTTKINDGTNTAAVKAASTAALVADPSLVIAISPNSPLPTGTNSIGTVTAVQATAANLRAQTSSEANTGAAPPTQGSLNMGTATTAAPTYTNNTANALSLTTAGALRTDSSATTQPVSGTVTSNQGTAAALAGYWPVRVTDGTNTMPTGDVAARAGYIRVTDGTNIQPAGDVVARSQFIQISDGVTGPAAVIEANASPTVTDKSLVVQISPNQDPIPTTVVPATSIAGSAVGRVAGISANTFTAIRQTTYVEQTTNAQRSIVSTSANDSAAGTGARQVRITYLTATGTGPFTETVTLNGTTAVNTVATDICFIERMDVTSVGSNASNVGTLNLYTATAAGGTIFAAIGTGALATGVGDNQTLYAHHYVPVNYRVSGFYVSCGVIASAGGGSSTSIIRYRNPTVATSPWMLASDIINAAQGNSASRVYYVSIPITGPAVVLGYSTPGTNNSTLTVSFDYADAPV